MVMTPNEMVLEAELNRVCADLAEAEEELASVWDVLVFVDKGEVMEQELHDEIESALRFAERKPKLIEALLVEQSAIQGKLAALGYQPPKRTRKPRTASGEAAPATKRKKSSQ